MFQENRPVLKTGGGDIPFFVAIEKAYHTPEGDWVVEGPLSSSRKDLQGEVVLADAIAKGLNTYHRLGKPVDYDHQSVKDKSPRWIIGEGLDVFEGPSVDGGSTYHLRCRLFKSKPLAQEVWEHIQSGGRMAYSIGGSVTERDGHLIKGTEITHVALTPYPANPDAVVGVGALAKSLSVLAADEGGDTPEDDVADYGSARLAKALVAAGAAAGTSSEGFRAAVEEDVEAPKKRKRKARKRRENDMSKNILLDDETVEQLEALEDDEKTGPLAKALNAVLSLLKGKAAPPPEDDEYDEEEDEDEVEPDGDEDDEEEDEDEVEPDDDEDDEEEDEAPPPAPLKKSVDEDEGITPVDADELLKSIADIVNEAVAPLAKKVARLEKSLAAPRADDELLKDIHAGMERMGFAPKRDAAPAKQYDVLQKGTDTPDKQAIADTLLKGVLQGRLGSLDVVSWETGGGLSAAAQAYIESVGK